MAVADGNFHNVSKLELLAMTCHAGFRPIENVVGSAMQFRSGDPLIVSTQMLMRSRLYFDALLKSSDIFSRGLISFHHVATHAYYACILALDSFERVNAIADVPSEAAATWKAIADLRAVPGVDVVDEDNGLVAVQDGVVHMALPAMPPPPSSSTV